ncbi:MAG: phasin family protein [Hyphomicrobiales bacterium]
MSKSPLNFEIPTEMRIVAEKSVEQAKKAFDGFFDAAGKAVVAADAHAASLQSNTGQLARKTFGYAEHNVAAAFDYAAKLVNAKDMQDFMNIQSDFVKTQIGTLQSQMTDIGSTVQSSARKTAEDVQSTIEKASSEMQRTASHAFKG